MPGYWHTDAPQDPAVPAGYVELYFRTSQRLFVLKFPGQEDRISVSSCRLIRCERNTAPGPTGRARILQRRKARNLPVPLVETSIRFATKWIIRNDKVKRHAGGMLYP